MAYFPLFVNLNDRLVLIVGGGKVAARRAASLSGFGCRIRVVSPEICKELCRLLKNGQIDWLQKKYETGTLLDEGRPAFVLAAGPSGVNEAVVRDCRSLGIPVNDASQKERCDFYFPGLIRQGETVIGVTSGGTDHRLAASLSAVVRDYMKERGESRGEKQRKKEPGPVDLHVHSTASDGSLTPSELVSLAVKNGLSAIALTDHDTVSGIDEALTAAGEIEVIPGIEISCIYEEKELHILGLFIDHHSRGLACFLEAAAARRKERNRKILEAFQRDGFQLSWEDLLSGHQETTVTRAHFARALLKKGYVSSVDQAFREYLNPECPYYRPREAILPKEALEAIRSAGGLSVLAHPCQYRLGWNKTEVLLSYLKDLGLDGVECWHSSNHIEESRKLRSLAEAYGLFPTGGSDFHGAAKPDIELGKGRGNLRIPYSVLENVRRHRHF